MYIFVCDLTNLPVISAMVTHRTGTPGTVDPILYIFSTSHVRQDTTNTEINSGVNNVDFRSMKLLAGVNMSGHDPDDTVIRPMSAPGQITCGTKFDSWRSRRI